MLDCLQRIWHKSWSKYDEIGTQNISDVKSCSTLNLKESLLEILHIQPSLTNVYSYRISFIKQLLADLLVTYTIS